MLINSNLNHPEDAQLEPESEADMLPEDAQLEPESEADMLPEETDNIPLGDRPISDFT